MQTPRIKDLIDWHGCEAVEFDPLKLGGRATVGNTRMDADGIFINYESGMTVEDIKENFGVERKVIEQILAFGLPRRLKSVLEGSARPQHSSKDAHHPYRS